MTGKDRIILQKTINYARDAVQYISGMDLEQFMDDRKTISACAFCIGQIGELVKEVDPLTQDANPKIPWRSIRGMRNKIIHDYENIDLAVLWGTITKSLPELILQMHHLLAIETLTALTLEENEDEYER
ncbi:HepT-like ribonuclease domain-containing protein [Desulfosporosinus sp. BG]|uniref:HepT-like ribonuclease domain-containing protein n=1 Tax=Desulfosporosinus sp. BG TaxID=1633135 RepID=UPI000839F8C3|nr:HepT-like ribonuclease domain-containing protein [Desulfosporosinus sp. BG]ODA42731.1 UPF0331 protein [Desulfosporosinus sp. BG]